MPLEMIKGSNTDEKIKSIDGLLCSFDRRLKKKTPEEGLKAELANIRQTLNALMEYLGVEAEPGPKRIMKKTKLMEEPIAINTINTE